MKTSLMICLLLWVSLYSFAQKDTLIKLPRNKGLERYIGVGASYNNPQNLNSALTSSSLPTVGKFNIAGVIEGDLRFRNFIVGLEVNANTSPKTSGDYNITSQIFEEEINAGYNIINSSKFHLAPQAGIGLLTNSVRVTQKDNIDDFNELLATKNSIDINQTIGVLDFCLKLDFADFTKRKSETEVIKIGYEYGLSRGGWGVDENNNSTISNSPRDRLSQVYVLFCFGMAREKSDR